MTPPETPPETPPKAPGADCAACPLRDRPMVAGSGPKRAQIVLVGQSPGNDEVRQGAPFVGRPGQLLNRTLAAYGIDREAVYVTNTVLCHPPRNELKKYLPAIACCAPRLRREIAEHEPEKVLALGTEAAQTLLETKEKITKLRVGGGRPSPWGKYMVIPTVHPAFVLRSPDQAKTLQADVARLVEQIVSVVWEPTKFKVPGTVNNAIATLQAQIEARTSEYLALDIEVDVPRGSKSFPGNPQWLCIGIAHAPGRAVVYPEHVVKSPAFQHALRTALGESGVKWVYQNGKFDVPHLWTFAPEATIDEDTMLAHYATDERKGTHDLETLATEYLNAPNYKTEAKQWLKYKDDPMSLLPKSVLHKYNATDVDATIRLLPLLQKEMRNDGVEKVYRELLIPGANALSYVETRGVAVDLEQLDRLEEALAEATEETYERVVAQWGINPRSVPQLKAKLAELGHAVSGTGKDIIAALGEPLANAVLDHRKVVKLLSTYVRGSRKHIAQDGRIHANFKLHGTETGRLSCGDPNLQNYPREGGLRDIVRASDGMMLLAGDYKNVEVVMAGEYSGDANIRALFEAKRNLHDEVARNYYGDSYKGKTLDKERYTVVKTVVFGVFYGESAGHLAQRLGISFKEAAGIITTLKRQFPDFFQWQRTLDHEILTRHTLTSLFGRKRRFWLITRENRHEVLKEGYNFPLQSAASDLTLRSLIRLIPLLKGLAHPVITVHDSLVFEVMPDNLAEVRHIVQDVMEDTGLSIPTTVDFEVGVRWGSLTSMEN